jgi:phosphotransferase system enzyme I (PtsI)
MRHQLIPGEETVLKGLKVSEGVSIAPVCLFNEHRHNNLPLYKVPKDSTKLEIVHFERAVSIVEGQLDTLYKDICNKVGEAEAQIFSAQKVILKDCSLKQKVVELIENRNYSAGSATVEVLEGYETLISHIDDQYIKERASDIGEIKRRLLDVLIDINPSLKCGNTSHCQKGKNRIVVAEEITPTLTLYLDTDNTSGFVTERGGAASHAAILARGLGIPAVSGLKNIHNQLFCSTMLIIDGDNGLVIAWPSEKTIEEYSSKVVFDRRVPPENIRTPKKFQVLFNISKSSEIDEALALAPDGIGLYRTEYECLTGNNLLTEQRQYEIYSKVLKSMGGKPVYLRVLDLGGDKSASFLDLPKEDNPYLGLRGARLLQAKPELLIPQARAIAKASVFGPVNVMFPMITDLVQFRKLKAVFKESISDINAGEIHYGLMFEVPSACLQAGQILKEAEFGSIGSNDLIQYLFAVDRNNELVAHDYSADNPIFWNLLRKIIRAAEKNRRPLSICGEIAGYPEYISKLIASGIKTFSVSHRLIPSVRTEIERCMK